VTLLDVVLAVEGDESPFRCTEIRRRGPSAGGLSTVMPPCAIAASMYRAENAWRAELAATTFADVTERMLRQVPAAAMELGARWLETAVTHPAAAQS
jgi:DNA-binding IscR family transcriptional regulator